MRDSSVEMLQVYLTSIIESIVGSVDQCPPVMRVAFKQLHKRVEEQFTEPENEVSLGRRGQRESNSLAAIARLSCSTESSDIPHVQCRRCRSEREGILRLVDLCPCSQDVKYLAISGFFFLRFFAPAILTPKLFQLRDQHADTRTSRTLLLLAKVGFTTQTLMIGLRCYSRVRRHPLV